MEEDAPGGGWFPPPASLRTRITWRRACLSALPPPCLIPLAREGPDPALPNAAGNLPAGFGRNGPFTVDFFPVNQLL